MITLNKRASQGCFAIALLAIVVACTVNPVTGERELSLISQQQAIQLGAQNYSPGQQSQGGTYTLDPALNTYIAEVGNRLAAVSDVPNLPYEFVVLNNSVPNAWALPGGKIAINRGLLTELEDESQLAAVLGHEIVHAAAGHGASQMSRNMLLGAGLSIGGIALQDNRYGDLIALGSQIGASAWMASYGREDELESDHYGMTYMVRAGYDPQGAVELQRTFVRLSDGGSSDFISGLFASHPPSSQRVAANQAYAEQLPNGETFRARYQQHIAQLLSDQPAYDAQDKATEAMNNNQPRLALEYLDQAVKIQPDEGQFWEMRGHAWRALDDNRSAEQAFSTAIRKNDTYYRHWLARGLLRQQTGDESGARSDLERAEQLLPTSTGSYALAELAEARGDISTAMGYYQQVASGSGELAAAATLKVVSYDLPQNPSRYFSGGLAQDERGQLVVLIVNQSPVTVRNVRVRVTQLSSGLGRDLALRGTLASGQQGAIATGISGDLAEFGLQVIAAEAR